jgi:peptide deformylase
MPLKIVQYNEPVLRTKGAKISQFDESLVKLAQDMIATMHEAPGIGLAAQQIGLSLQFCVVDLRDTDAEFTWELDGAKPPLGVIMPMALANPEVTVTPGTRESLCEEGCLSFPEIRGNVARRESISVNFRDERGIPHVLKCTGLFARCIQHEDDHLNGVLFIERMDTKTRAAIDPAVKALARQNQANRPK